MVIAAKIITLINLVIELAYIIIFLMSGLDHIFTFYHLSRGAQELNPIMQRIMEQPFWVSFAIKNGWVAGLLILLYIIESKYLQVANLAWYGKNVLLAAYGLLICYHLLCFYL